MLYLFNQQRIRLGSFHSYDQLIDLFHKPASCEVKGIANPVSTQTRVKGLAKPGWRFSCFPYAFLKTLHTAGDACLDQEAEQQALGQKLALVEIQKGATTPVLQIPVTAQVNTLDLKRDWCFAFCLAHDYLLLETVEDIEEEDEDTLGGLIDNLIL